MLKGLTNTIKNACSDIELTLSEYIVIDGKTIPIKAELNDYCYDNGNFVGTFILKELKFEASNEISYINKEFEYYKRINDESIKIGTFITTEINNSDSEEVTKVVTMDYGLKTQVEYKSNLDYSSGNITLLDVWNECCELSGLESGVTEFTNSNFIVTDDQFTGTGATIRDVFIGIGLSSGSFIKVMNDDKIYPIFSEETDEIIEEYTELEDKRDTQPITCLRLGLSQIEGENVDIQDEELIKQYGENWLIINDNPFAYTQEKRVQLIDAIFNKVKGFGYSAFVSKTSFKPYLTCGDVIRFKNKAGELVKSIVLRYNHNFDEINLEAPSETSAAVNYVYPTKDIDLIKRTEIIVDKNTNQITSLAKEVTESQQLNNERILELTEITNSVQETITTTEQTIEVMQKEIINGKENLKNNLVTIDINGISVATNLSAISTLITNDTFIIKSGNTYLAYFGYDNKSGQTVAKMDNLTVTNYLTTGHHRIEKFEPDGEQRTGVFFIGGVY